MKKYLPLKSEIQTYLSQNSNCGMKGAAEYFQIPYKSFRKFVQTELDATYWQVKKSEKKIRPMKIYQDIQIAYEKNSKTVTDAYAVYCSIPDHIPITERVFRNLCREKNLVFQLVSVKVFLITDFDKIFSKNQNKVESKTLRRSFYRLLNDKKTKEAFLSLDPTLTDEHLLRYLLWKEKDCWLCGKTQHFGLPILMDLDHISGESTNHLLSNLRLVCGCCHKITDTHSIRADSRKTSSLESTTSLYQNILPGVSIKTLKDEFRKNMEKA